LRWTAEPVYAGSYDHRVYALRAQTAGGIRSRTCSWPSTIPSRVGGADLYRRMADMAESIHGAQRRAQRHHPRMGGPAARVSPPHSARSVVPRAWMG